MRLSFKEQFFKKDRFYRLEAIRSVKKDNRFTHLTVNFFPLIDHYSLYKLKQLSYINSYSEYFDCTGQDRYKISLILEVEITLLSQLEPGSIWKATDSISIRRVFEPTKKNSISIGENRENVTYSEIKQKLGKNNNFKFLKKDNSLYLLAISDSIVRNKKTTVLIPHSEIIRFFFTGTSQYFTERIFTEDPIAETATLIGGVEENTDLCKIRLNSRHYYDSDAPFIAQALLDKITMHAMRMIYSSLYSFLSHSKDKDYINELPLKTTLPFQKKTDLDVIGYFVSKDKKFFLVRQIVTSHHTWAFKGLQIMSAEAFPRQPRSGYTNNIRNQRAQIFDDNVNLIIGETPHANKPELDIIVNDKERFPFLSTIKVSKVTDEQLTQEKPDENIGIKQFLNNEDVIISEGSLGTPNFQQNSTMSPVQLLQEQNHSEIKSFSEIARIFHEIETDHSNWTITALPINKINQSTPYGEFQFGYPNWSKVQQRYRRALLLKIKITDQLPIYCLEIESDRNRKFGIYFFSEVSSNVGLKPIELLETIDKKQGKGIKKLLSKYFNKIKRLNHTNVGNSLKNRIFEHITKSS